AFAAAALLLWQIRLAPPPGRAPAAGPSWIVDLYSWIGAGSIQVPLRLLVDPLSVAMALVVGGVGLLIHVYSVGYMDGDPGCARYFAYLNLFMASMFWLVLAGNLAAMFIGWEGVGLCSYLLIAFWFTRPAAAAAGVKAFLVTRLGDVGFLLGIFVAFGVFGTTDFGVMTRDAGDRLALGGGAATALALLLFAGAAGKSAQLPLYVWLPNAMEGPTPVSALIHAATMVTAGVYMIVRLHAVFLRAPAAMDLIAAVGAVTAIFAAAAALVEPDLKRVLAYSTISQLGYMFLAVGVGAFSAGIFHLTSHAFFKALLFLAAGAVMHALGGLTAVYILRAFALTFLGADLRGAEGAAHDPPPSMAAPMWILAGLTVAGGGLGWSFTHPGILERFLLTVLRGGAAAPARAGGAGEGTLVAASVLVAVAGIVVGWLVYVRRSLRGGVPALARLLSRRFYIEDAYAVAVIGPVRALACAAAVADRTVIDAAVMGLARAVGRSGQALRGLETGYLRHYAAFVLIGVLLILVYWVSR